MAMRCRWRRASGSSCSRTVPGPARWLLRIVGWSVAALVFIAIYRVGNAYRTVEFAGQCTRESQFKGEHQTNLGYAQRFSACMFLRSNFFEAWRTEPSLRHVMALPSAPCARIGVWKSTRRRSVYRVALRDDSSFIAEPVASPANPQAETVSGFWGEHEGRMVWIYDNGILWPPDINPIENDSAGSFTLVEANGERTDFIREENLPSQRCPD